MTGPNMTYTGKSPEDSVEDAYDRISEYFHHHRRDLWPPMEQFLDEPGEHGTLLDLGCGTGRALKAASLRGYRVIGVDISSNQLEEASGSIRTLGPVDCELIKADIRNVPLPDGISSATLMIAVLHHLIDRVSRIEALREAARLTSVQGRLLVSVWSWDQDRFRERHLSRLNERRPLDEDDGPLPGDLFVPWKDGVTVRRFYHLYGPHELDGEVISAGWSLRRSYFDGRNHWVEAYRDE